MKRALQAYFTGLTLWKLPFVKADARIIFELSMLPVSSSRGHWTGGQPKGISAGTTLPTS